MAYCWAPRLHCRSRTTAFTFVGTHLPPWPALPSVHLVLKGCVLMGDARSDLCGFHSIVLAVLGYPLWLQGIARPPKMILPVATGYLKDNNQSMNTMMGIIFQLHVCTGVIFSYGQTRHTHLELPYSFRRRIRGKQSTSNLNDDDDCCRAGITRLLFIGVKWRDFCYFSFDVSWAPSGGLPHA